MRTAGIERVRSGGGQQVGQDGSHPSRLSERAILGRDQRLYPELAESIRQKDLVGCARTDDYANVMSQASRLAGEEEQWRDAIAAADHQLVWRGLVTSGRRVNQPEAVAKRPPPPEVVTGTQRVQRSREGSDRGNGEAKRGAGEQAEG